MRTFSLVFISQKIQVSVWQPASRLMTWDVNSQAALSSSSCASSQEVCPKDSQPVGGLCRLNLIVSPVLNKSHSSSACPLSQISGSVTGGISWKTRRLFHYTFLPPVMMEVFAFFGHSGSKLLDLARGFLRPILGHVLHPWSSHRNAYWIESLLRLYKMLLVNGQGWVL